MPYSLGRGAAGVELTEQGVADPLLPALGGPAVFGDEQEEELFALHRVEDAGGVVDGQARREACFSESDSTTQVKLAFRSRWFA